MKRFSLCCMFLCVLLIGCHESKSFDTKSVPYPVISSPTSFQKIVQYPSKAVEITPLKTVTVSSTPSRATHTPNASQLPIRSIEKHCVTLQNSPASDFLSGGAVILARFQRPVGGTADLMVLKPKGMVYPLSLPKYNGLAAVSSDKRWLSYWDGEKFNVISSDGTIEASFSNGDWQGTQGWLDANRIVFVRADRTQPGLDIFDPFENKTQTLEPGFTDFWRFDFESSGWIVWKLVYDPTLTRVAYMQNDHGPQFVLLDLKSNHKMWQYQRGSIGLNDPPQWSPDGKFLEVIASGDPEDNFERFQLFLINYEGIPVQWVEIPSDIIFDKSGAQWSPDNRYIAFHGKSLYVLDLLNHRLVDYCISPNPDHQGSGEILWSPNSKQVIYQRDGSPGLLVDLDKDMATSISNDTQTIPIGWLTGTP